MTVSVLWLLSGISKLSVVPTVCLLSLPDYGEVPPTVATSKHLYVLYRLMLCPAILGNEQPTRMVSGKFCCFLDPLVHQFHSVAFSLILIYFDICLPMTIANVDTILDSMVIIQLTYYTWSLSDAVFPALVFALSNTTTLNK